MINSDYCANENKTKHNLNWPYIPDHPYRILIIGGSGSGKMNALLNLTNKQRDVDKIYLYAKDPCEDKHQFLIIKRESIRLKQAKNSEEDFNNYLEMIRRGNKTKKWGNTLANIDRIFNGRNDAIKFIEDHGSMILEAKKKLQKKQQKEQHLKY